jgi:hypothetical protein
VLRLKVLSTIICLLFLALWKKRFSLC